MNSPPGQTYPPSPFFKNYGILISMFYAVSFIFSIIIVIILVALQPPLLIAIGLVILIILALALASSRTKDFSEDISLIYDPIRKITCSNIVVRHRFTHEKGNALNPDRLWGFQQKRHFVFLIHGPVPAITMTIKFKTPLPMAIDMKLKGNTTGKTPFFQRFHITCPDEAAKYAFLTEQTREAISELISGARECHMTNREISIKKEMEYQKMWQKEIEWFINLGVKLDKGLKNNRPIKKRLIENIQDGTDYGIMKENLTLLLTTFPGDERIQSVIQSISRQKNHPLRLDAAYLNGEEGYPVIVEELQNPQSEMIHIAAEFAEKIGDELFIPGLIKAFGYQGLTVKTQKVILTTLGQIGDTEASPFLVELLESPDLDREIKHSARAALKKIQSEARPEEKGRMSIAPADDSHGALSIPQK